MFEKILETNLINFIIVISTLVWIFKKAHLGEIINKMANDIKANVEKNELELHNARNDYSNAKKSVKDTPKLRQEIIEKIQVLTIEEKDKIQNETKLKKEQIENFARDKKISDTKKFKTSVIDSIYNVSLNLAKEETIKLLNSDKGIELHNKIIESLIDDLDKLNLKEGQNESKIS